MSACLPGSLFFFGREYDACCRELFFRSRAYLRQIGEIRLVIEQRGGNILEEIHVAGVARQ